MSRSPVHHLLQARYVVLAALHHAAQLLVVLDHVYEAQVQRLGGHEERLWHPHTTLDKATGSEGSPPSTDSST